jgi:hypothetical protein
MAMRELLERAREEVHEVTGHEVESISGFQRDGDDSLQVTVEVLEVPRIPNTMDLLATYVVTLSGDGEVVGLQRRRRYHRAAVEEGG